MRALPCLVLLIACGGGMLTIDEDDRSLRPGGDGSADPGTDTGDSDDADPDDADTDTDPGDDPDPVPDCVPFGVSVDGGLTLNHGSVLSGVDPSGPQAATAPTTVSTNSVARCALNLLHGEITGDVSVGPDGYPDVVVCQSRSSRITGRQHVLGESIALVDAPLPDGLPASGGDRLFEWNEVATFVTDRVFDRLRVRTGSRLTVDGDIDVYVAGAFELNGGHIDLTPGSRLRLWVGRDAQVIWASGLNVDGDARAVDIFLLDGASLAMNHGSTVEARIWAPRASARIEGGGTLLRGSLQAAEADVLWGARVAVPTDLVCR